RGRWRTSAALNRKAPRTRGRAAPVRTRFTGGKARSALAPARRSCTRRVCLADDLLEDEVAGDHVDMDDGAVALGVTALEQSQGEGIADLPLDDPLQGTGAVDRVVALLGQQGTGLVGDVQAQATLGQAIGEVAQLDVDDL